MPKIYEKYTDISQLKTYIEEGGEIEPLDFLNFFFYDSYVFRALRPEQVELVALYFSKIELMTTELDRLFWSTPIIKNFDPNQKAEVIFGWLGANKPEFSALLDLLFQSDISERADITKLLIKWSEVNKHNFLTPDLEFLRTHDLFLVFSEQQKEEIIADITKTRLVETAQQVEPEQQEAPSSPVQFTSQRQFQAAATSRPQTPLDLDHMSDATALHYANQILVGNPVRKDIFLALFKKDDSFFDSKELAKKGDDVNATKELIATSWLEYSKDDLSYDEIMNLVTAEGGLAKLSANAKCRFVASWLQKPQSNMQGRNLLSLIKPEGILANAEEENKLLVISNWLDKNKTVLEFNTIAATIDAFSQFVTITPQQKTFILQDIQSNRRFAAQKGQGYTVSPQPRSISADPGSPVRRASASPTKTSSPPRISAPLPRGLSFDELVQFMTENKITKEFSIAQKTLMVTKWLNQDENQQEIRKKGFFDKLLSLLNPDHILAYCYIPNPTSGRLVPYPTPVTTKLEIILDWIAKCGPESISTMQMLALCTQGNIFEEATPQEKIKIYEESQRVIDDNLTALELISLFSANAAFAICDSMLKSYVIIEWLKRPQNNLTPANLVQLFDLCPDLLLKQRQAISQKCAEKEETKKAGILAVSTISPDFIRKNLTEIDAANIVSFFSKNKDFTTEHKATVILMALTIQESPDNRREMLNLFYIDDDLKKTSLQERKVLVTNFLTSQQDPQRIQFRKEITMSGILEHNFPNPIPSIQNSIAKTLEDLKIHQEKR